MVRTKQGLLSGCVTRPTQKLLKPSFRLMGLLATASVVLRTSTRKRATPSRTSSLGTKTLDAHLDEPTRLLTTSMFSGYSH